MKLIICCSAGLTLTWFLCAQEPALHARRRQTVDTFRGINAAGRRRQHIGVQIRRENPGIPSRGQVLLQRHGDGIGLFTSRATRRPDPQTPGGGVAPQQFRKHRCLQVLEVVVLPKECRQIGGDGIDEFGEFLVSMGIQILAVRLEVPELQFPDTPCETRIEHVEFVIGNDDPGMGAGEFAQDIEIVPRVFEFPRFFPYHIHRCSYHGPLINLQKIRNIQQPRRFDKLRRRCGYAHLQAGFQCLLPEDDQ